MFTFKGMTDTISIVMAEDCNELLPSCKKRRRLNEGNLQTEHGFDSAITFTLHFLERQGMYFKMRSSNSLLVSTSVKLPHPGKHRSTE